MIDMKNNNDWYENDVTNIIGRCAYKHPNHIFDIDIIIVNMLL